jgi:hypothetical protein
MLNKYTATSFEIDPHKLDVCWLEQVPMFHDFAMEAANLRRDLDHLKAEEELIEAEKSNYIRQHPEELGANVKPTEASYAAWVSTHKSVKKIKDSIIEKKHELDVCQAGINTLEHRKRALENLVELHGADYFSSPTAKSENAKEGVEKFKKRRAREYDSE